MADQFCLRWNNFQSNIVNALDSLKCSEDLVDVTLTCEGRNIKAHKVILSACSPYFRNVFKENPCQHPVIILKDVLADDIVGLLSYMYQGEVFIEESKLSSFLHTAALLQVKGLTGVTHMRENLQPAANTSNKLYNQLTISPKPNIQKETKVPLLKKRRSSTSDKPNEVTINTKKSKLESEFYNNIFNIFKDGVSVENNNIEKKDKSDMPIANGKPVINKQTSNGQPDVVIKTEVSEDSPAEATQKSHDEDETHDYENSMLARSLLSGINPSKTDANTNAKKNPKQDIPTRKETDSADKSPTKCEDNIKSEKHSPNSEIDYEPEILLSEQQDDSQEENYTQDQTQALLMLAGMSSSLTIASTSQGVAHQSNHAAICGDCPHCGMKYSNQSALKYHVRLMHSDLTNRLCCYLCPRSFTMRETFKEHMWSSHGQRN